MPYPALLSMVIGRGSWPESFLTSIAGTVPKLKTSAGVANAKLKTSAGVANAEFETPAGVATQTHRNTGFCSLSRIFHTTPIGNGRIARRSMGRKSAPAASGAS